MILNSWFIKFPTSSLLLIEIIFFFGLDYFIDKGNLRRRSQLRINEFISRFYGKDCIIVGNGPSLNKTDLQTIANRNNYCILSSNGFFYYSDSTNFYADLLAVEDPFPANDMRDKILNYPALVVAPFDLLGIMGLSNNTYVKFLRRFSFLKLFGTRFSLKFPEYSYWGGTVTYFLLQIACSLNPKNIYLVGCDLNYQVREGEQVGKNKFFSTLEDVNHFSPHYFKNKYWHDPKVPQMHIAFAEAFKSLSRAGINVFNMSPDTKISSIPLKNFSDIQI